MKTLVVARHTEDIGWINRVEGANVVVLNKSALGNTGREAASYLWFIVNNWHSLHGDYIFCQGDPFSHCPDFIYQLWKLRHYGLVCRWPECHSGGTMLTRDQLEDFIEELTHETGIDLNVDLNRFYFSNGAQFMVSTQEIKAHPWMFYVAALNIACHNPHAPYCFEALWGHIIPSVRLTVKSDDEVHFGKP